MSRPFITVLLGKTAFHIEAVLFDKDGTIIDSLGPWAETERLLIHQLVTARLDKPAPEATVERLTAEFLASLGITEWGIDRGGLLAGGTAAEIYEVLKTALEQTFGEKLDMATFIQEAETILNSLLPLGSPESKAVPGAEETLNALAGAGLPLGLATSDDERHTLADLRRLGLQDWFTFISTGDTTKAPKPDPWVVEEFSRCTGAPAERILVVGDTDVDNETARNGGAALFVRVRDSLEDLVPQLLSGSLLQEGPGNAAADSPFPRLRVCSVSKL